ncbi:hypothetical protein NDU88_004434, partial [Pleurodeles waltl]
TFSIFVRTLLTCTCEEENGGNSFFRGRAVRESRKKVPVFGRNYSQSVDSVNLGFLRVRGGLTRLWILNAILKGGA